jgi:hypothetical protein
MELEVDMLSVHGKLVKDVVHSSRRKDDFYKKNAFVILKELAPSKVA